MSFKFLSLTGPSGAGKTEIQNGLAALATNLDIVISNTTREPRPSDKPGAYRHGTVSTLEQEEAASDVAWKKQFGSHWYWTRKSDLATAARSSNLASIILLPETVPILRKLYPSKVLSIWVVPPREAELRSRLMSRGDAPDQIQRVLAETLEWVPDGTIPYQFVYNRGAMEITMDHLRKMLRAHNFRLQLR